MVKKIYVGTKHEPAPVPVQKQPAVRKPGLVSKMIEVIKEDMDRSTSHIKALVTDPPPGWGEYRKFLELSNQGKVK